MPETKPLPSTLINKPHFEILDGLRGVAAIAVVIFHFMEIAITDPENNFIAHAYLAVDFFFCLSGFVIAYAYDDKMDNMGIATFLKRRLIRLHPLVITGSVLGLLTFLFDPISDLHQTYANKIWLLFICSCFMIPFPIVKERYLNLFHLNPPTWSLFWEYIANIFYAIILVRLPRKILLVLTVLAAGALVYESYQSTHLSVGWGGDNITGGGIRVSFSFLAGMLIYRFRWIIQSKLGFVSLGVLLLPAFLFPFSNTYSWLADPLIVILYFPLLIMLGAGATTHKTTQAICRFSGKISYPLYMVHYPFIWIFFSYVEKYKPALPEMIGIMIIGTALLLLFAFVVLKYVDEPVRKWLSGRPS
ncbi:acyltransferase [Niastella yeongjuensis]|uniref:Acyltransferase n=1 Tax=Niastella yeongjuensis TaxID=354355 RepID=A0A1V9E3W0_9BACT|nr:acyltransferase [Niastella yeongjuensis]OQP40779.1 acyltransferase [Niastella yeongjuensis]SEP01964.1 Peptidoglycan/LPS O-acetylase OafA/YrhL, contains acyltransferase and SGNH-hydrolase domains [Niastella yeongjuensis]